MKPPLDEGVGPPTGPPPVKRPDREPRSRDEATRRERRKKREPEPPPPPPPEPEGPKGRKIDIQA